MDITIENMQNKIEITRRLQDLIKKTAVESLRYEKFETPSEINIILADNEIIRHINKEQRNIDNSTDVLSFPMVNIIEGKIISAEGDFDLDENLMLLGDIVLSVEKAREQADNYGHTFEREVAFLISHGVFHLLGYDHMDEASEKVMMSRQESVLTSMGLTR
jgi:probable rRNA maturation factor